MMAPVNDFSKLDGEDACEDSSVEPRSYLVSDEESRKYSESLIIIGGSRREGHALSPQLIESRIGGFFKSDARDHASECTDSDDKRDLRARINAMALREIEADIAARELELATMKRARARFAERRGSLSRADLKAHKGMRMKPPAHLTTSEVADALRVTVDTVQRSIADGRIPAVRIGRRWLIPADHIESLLSVKP